VITLLPTVIIMLDAFYNARDERSKVAFGSNYDPQCGENFPHAEWVQVANYEGTSDGSDCTVFEQRLPARFFRLEVKKLRPGTSIYDTFVLETGSGEEKLAAMMAEAFAEGMLSVELRKGDL
jgi:hypothetical protein